MGRFFWVVITSLFFCLDYLIDIQPAVCKVLILTCKPTVRQCLAMRQVYALVFVFLFLGSLVSIQCVETGYGFEANDSNLEYGVCVHLEQYDNDTIGLLVSLNVRWVRIDWIPNEMDNFVTVMKANGIKILSILDHNTMDQQNFTLLQWQNTVEAIMQTESAKKVDAWEIWNEPNMDQFYFGYMDGNPEHYFDMLKIANQTIKTNSPAATIVAAGLSPYTSSFGTWVTWLTDFSKLSPQSYFDYQGVHLYDDAVPNQYVINQTRTIMNVPDVWVTEIGQPSAPDVFSEEKQSMYLRSNFLMLQTTTVNPVFWYQLKDESDLTPDKENHFGLYTVENKPKLSSETYNEFSSPKPKPTPTLLPTSNPASNNQTTTTVQPTATPAASPTVPELSLFVIIPLMFSLLILGVVMKYRRNSPTNRNSLISSSFG